MSGHSWSDDCPNCQGTDTNFYQDHKPFQFIQFDCLECGMYSQTTIAQMDIPELNQTRKYYGDYDDEDFIPVETQKPLNKDWFGVFMKREDTHEKRIYAIPYAYIQSINSDVDTIKKMSDKNFINHAERGGMVWSKLEIFIDDLNNHNLQQVVCNNTVHRVIEVAK